MADTPATTSKPVVKVGDHDRVVALSIRADGSLDQTNPEIIGDKDLALDATKRQFAEIAVNAVDAEKRSVLGLAGQADVDTADAAIDALKKEHDSAVEAAEKRAESVINSLTK